MAINDDHKLRLRSGRRHILYDVWVSEAAVLARVGDWPHWLTTAAEEAGATVLHTKFHQFDPQGVTGFLMLAESHISLHTWPEEGFAAVDIFTCGRIDPYDIVAAIRARLDTAVERERITAVDR